MTGKKYFSPHWSWWQRSGERLAVGLDIRKVMDVNGTGLTGQDRQGLRECMNRIDRGDSVISSLQDSGCKLPVEAWCLLESGERTGRLGEAMTEVGSLLKEQKNRSRELLGQLWYPAVVLITGFLVMAIILTWVVPQMREISQSIGQGGKVPWLTEHIGTVYGVLFASGAGAFCLTLILWKLLQLVSRSSLGWASAKEKLCGRIPFLGPIRMARREARILRQVGTMLRGGITLPEALQMAASRSPDMFESYQLSEFRKRLLMGISFEESLVVCRVINPESQPLLLTGQETGKLDGHALRIAADLDREILWKTRQLVQVIEPVTIVILAGLITGLVLAYLLPTISMLEQLA